jgi:hypothetical protein
LAAFLQSQQPPAEEGATATDEDGAEVEVEEVES